MNLKSFTRLAVLVISVISFFFWGTIAFSSEEGGGLITPIMTVAFIVLAVAIVLVLVYTIQGLVSKKGDLKRTFISIGAFLGVILISFILADSSPVTVEAGVVEGTASKLVSTGLNTFYILAIAAIVLMFVSGFKRVKK
ncbi:MAG: hypothetical protein ACK4RM_00340 [Flavobacterium sp.]